MFLQDFNILIEEEINLKSDDWLLSLAKGQYFIIL